MASCIPTVLGDGITGSGVADFFYNAQTGALFLDTDGNNLISIVIEGPPADAIERFAGFDEATQTTWVQGYFDGYEQWINVSLAGISGVFKLATYDAGLTATAFPSVEYSVSGGTVEWTQLTRILFAADFDRNGSVDGGDLVAWKQDFGTTPHSDANNDGDSDGSDFLIWQRQFGSVDESSVQSVTVPEPASAGLLVMAAMAIYRMRYRGAKLLRRPPRSRGCGNQATRI